MVVRILLVVMVTLSCFALDFKHAYKAYQKGNYTQAIRNLNRVYGPRFNRYPVKALILKARAYEGNKEYTKSLRVLRWILKNKFKRENALVNGMMQKAEGFDEVDDLPLNLKRVYYSIFSVYVKIYLINPVDKIKKMASLYAELLLEQDFKAEVVERKINSLRAREVEKNNSIQKSRFFVGLNRQMWQDQLTLTSSSGSNEVIKSSAEGIGLFGGYIVGDARSEYRFDISYTSATATVGEDTEDFQYFQTGVKEVMMAISAGYFWRTGSQSAIGISIPLIYRTGDFTQPEGFSLDNTDIYSIGLLLGYSWSFQNLMLDFKMGKIMKFHSSFIHLGLSYSFSNIFN